MRETEQSKVGLLSDSMNPSCDSQHNSETKYNQFDNETLIQPSSPSSTAVAAATPSSSPQPAESIQTDLKEASSSSPSHTISSTLPSSVDPTTIGSVIPLKSTSSPQLHGAIASPASAMTALAIPRIDPIPIDIQSINCDSLTASGSSLSSSSLSSSTSDVSSSDPALFASASHILAQAAALTVKTTAPNGVMENSTAGLSPLSNLSPDSATPHSTVVTLEGGPIVESIQPVPMQYEEEKVSTRHLTGSNSLLQAEPSLTTLANLKTLNDNLNQNLNVLNHTIANLANLPSSTSHPTKSLPSSPTSVSVHHGHINKPLTSAVSKKKEPPTDQSCQSTIECGELLPNGKRNMSAYVEFFGKEVEIYTATIDPQRRHLYRASALAEKFGYATNKVGMYLARRRSAMSGIYQATSFRNKPSGRTGLKAGGYFLTAAACREFEHHFRQHDEMLGGMVPTPAPTMISRSSTNSRKKQDYESEGEDIDEGLNQEDDMVDEYEKIKPDEKVNASSRISRSRPSSVKPKPSTHATQPPLRARITSSEEEASANLALLAQFSPPPEPTINGAHSLIKSPPTSIQKKRSATEAKFDALTEAQRLVEEGQTNPSKRANYGKDAARKSTYPPVPNVSVRKIDASVTLHPIDPSHQPGLSPLSPLSDGSSPMPGLESQSVNGPTYPNDAKLPLAKSEAAPASTDASATKPEMVSQPYSYQHPPPTHYSSMAMPHGMPPPGSRPLYSYAPNTPSTSFGYAPISSPFNPSPIPNQFPSHNTKPMPISLPPVPPSNGNTNFHTPFLPTPLGMNNLMTPMQNFSPFNPNSMIISPTPHNNPSSNANPIMSPNGYSYHPSTAGMQMHPNSTPISLNITYSLNLPPNPSNGSTLMSPMSNGMMPFQHNTMMSPYPMPNYSSFQPMGMMSVPTPNSVNSSHPMMSTHPSTSIVPMPSASTPSPSSTHTPTNSNSNSNELKPETETASMQPNGNSS